MCEDMLDHITDQLFTKKWGQKNLSSDEVGYIICREKPIHHMLTNSRLGDKRWSYKKLQNLIYFSGKRKNERWNLPEEDQYLLVWKNHSPASSPPDALMSFNIGVVEKTRSDKASSIYLHNNLMWVHPGKRGYGLGLHLVTHFINYLQDCQIKYPYVSKRGISVDYYADFDSMGGAHLSEYISATLEYMKDSWSYHRVWWSIKKLNIAADF